MAHDKIVKLREVDGVVFASSRDVAEDFDKRHDHVLRDIESLRQDLPPILGAAWFRDDFYYGQDNTRRPCIDMTRDGWSLLVMGFTGKEVLAWKVAYILKFNEMEGKLGAGARTEALFDRSKRDNVVEFPPRPQADLFADALAPPPPADANRRHIDALVGEQRLASTWAGDVADEPVTDNPHIGVRSPPAVWGRPLTKTRSHHVRRTEGTYTCNCRVHEDGKLAEFYIHSEPLRATNMHERYLLMNTPHEFLLRFDRVNGVFAVSGLVANELLSRERECPKSPLSSRQAEAVLTFLTSGVS